MQVTKLSSECAMEHCHEVKKQTDEELQREYDFYMAEKMVDSMKDAGIISLEEYTKIREQNRKYFSPYLAELA